MFFILFAFPLPLPSLSSSSSTTPSSSIIPIPSISQAISVPKAASSQGRKINNPPPFPVSHYMLDYASYRNASRFTDMSAAMVY